MLGKWLTWSGALVLLMSIAAPGATWADQQDARLDGLFARLKTTSSLVEAAGLEQRIWSIWI